MAIRDKRGEYAVLLDAEGRVAADAGDPIRFGGDWTPEHLVLAALARCSIGALAHHAKRHALAVRGHAHASGAIGRREDDSWGFLELECRLEVTVEPEPGADDLRDLLRRAERGCFIGGSLDPKPAYRWTVNGREVRSAT